jgi:hypothetical protein
MKAFVMHGIGKASNQLASAINGAALPIDGGLVCSVS